MPSEIKECRLGVPEYPWNGEYRLHAKEYRFKPKYPVSFILLGSYGAKHEVFIAPFKKNRASALLACEEVNLTIEQLEVLKYAVNSGGEERKTAFLLGMKNSAFSTSLYRARNASRINGRVPVPAEFLIRTERLGLAHPDFLSWVLENYFVHKA